MIRSSLSKDIKIQIHLFKFGIQLILIYFPSIQTFVWTKSGADPRFQVRGAHLKKLRRTEGGAKICGVFRVKNHDFTLKNHIFFQF
jgi:hypothetical protein